MSDIIEVYL